MNSSAELQLAHVLRAVFTASSAQGPGVQAISGNLSPNFLLLRSPRIDSKESILPACVAWRAGTTTLFLLSSYSPHSLFQNSSTVPAYTLLYSIIESLRHQLNRSRNSKERVTLREY
jgi:hypothetical protein